MKTILVIVLIWLVIGYFTSKPAGLLSIAAGPLNLFRGGIGM